MTDTKDAIIAIERRFWQALVDYDTDAATALVADDCLVTGPMGAIRIDPVKYAAMMDEGSWSLDSFDFSDVEVVRPTPEIAIIAYHVHQTGTFKGDDMDMKCADSSVWIRSGGNWKCALHTETILSGG